MYPSPLHHSPLPQLEPLLFIYPREKSTMIFLLRLHHLLLNLRRATSVRRLGRRARRRHLRARTSRRVAVGAHAGRVVLRGRRVVAVREAVRPVGQGTLLVVVICVVVPPDLVQSRGCRAVRRRGEGRRQGAGVGHRDGEWMATLVDWLVGWASAR